MRKIISLLMFLFLFGAEFVCAKSYKELDPYMQRALVHKSLDITKDEKTRKFEFNCSDTVCCKRGPRGHRGKRGRRGRRGSDAAPGMNELFINAEMMFSSIVESFPVEPVSFQPYGTSEVRMRAWIMPSLSQFFLPPIGANFNIPIDLDRTQPVNVVVHMLVDSAAFTTGNMARIAVELDIQPNNGLIGTTPPATGPAFFAESADFIVSPATPLLSLNLRQVEVSIPFDLSTSTGSWAFIDVARVLATINEFSGNLYLSTISVQYSRIAS